MVILQNLEHWNDKKLDQYSTLLSRVLSADFVKMLMQGDLPRTGERSDTLRFFSRVAQPPRLGSRGLPARAGIATPTMPEESS
jgi:hypothetical protein